MLKRKIFNKLIEWKKIKGNECLFVKGARQIGKTFIIQEFGKTQYESFIEINFLKNPSLAEIFEGDFISDEIYKRITAHIPESRFIPKKTLIFLDEIQKCSRARTALKFLAEDNRFDVIVSGSLLGLHYGQDPEIDEIESVPVGYERQIIMYSLDFEEFLWAYGYKNETIEYLKSFFDKRQKVPEDLNKKFESIFREFLVVGGMPEVVQAFANNKDFNEVQRIQEKILASYDDDIANHAKGIEKIKVRSCYATIPSQLARENKKFKYSEVEKKATARKFGDSITWLKDSNLVHACTNINEPYLPLNANEKVEEFKLYINDTGLLLARYGFQTKLALLQNKLLGNAKGGIYENAISECLIKKGYSLHYYRTENGSLELEFLIEKDAQVIPIEVKAGNSATVSLNRFVEKFNPEIAYKLIDGNVGYSEKKLSIPHYMSLFL